MNETLRWTILLGCLLIAGLEVPRTSLLVLEDIEGPYAAPADGHATALPHSATIGSWLATAPRLAAVSCLPWTLGKSSLLWIRGSAFRP